jgi:hypothetical protein
MAERFQNGINLEFCLPVLRGGKHPVCRYTPG